MLNSERNENFSNRVLLWVTLLALTTGSLWAGSATGIGIQTAGPENDYATLRAQAEELVSEKSFAQARKVYLKLEKLVGAEGAEGAGEVRWVKFRLADLSWRAQAATQTRDDTVYQEARGKLTELVQSIKRVVDRDRGWAEAEESLGDLMAAENGNNYWQRDWSWVYYEKALDWWAGSADVELARERYLALVWKAARPRHGWGQSSFLGQPDLVNHLPRAVLQNARKIAVTKDNWARATFLLARKLEREGSDARSATVVENLYLELLESGRESEWFDDALYHYAQWLAERGLAVRNSETGRWQREPDFVKAVAVYTRLLKEFKPGQSAYVKPAQLRRAEITNTTLNLLIRQAFLPGSEVQYEIRYRNTGQIQFELFRVDLAEAVDFSVPVADGYDYLDRINETQLERVRRWKISGKEFGTHRQQVERLRLAHGEDGKPLATGAYLLRASAGLGAEKITTRELLLVSDVTLVLKTGSRGDKLLTYLCNAEDGSPIAGAELKMWLLRKIDRTRGADRWWGKVKTTVTNDDGLAYLEDLHARQRAGKGKPAQAFVIANIDGRQAFATANLYDWGRQTSDGDWRLYVYTDRPAYRPGETVEWKVTARRTKGSGYNTPGGEAVDYTITDARGAELKKAELTLNEFGSGWATLEVTESMPLGAVSINFKKGRRSLGGAQLFRLEEYKLPEFRVSVETATAAETEDAKVYRVGEVVEATIKAEYYFGGPVAGADVAVVVKRRDFVHTWQPKRPYPFHYEDDSAGWGGRGGWGGWGGWGGGGYHEEEVKRETIKTDSAGKAVVTFATPTDEPNKSFEYIIEARVVDSSRREVVGSGSVKVTQQSYFVYAEVEHHLYKPGETVAVTFHALDPNDQPRGVMGKVKVLRKTWVERWLNPAGREVPWDAVRTLRQQGGGVFPPADLNRRDGGPEYGWRLLREEYEYEEVLTQPVTTDAKTGAGVFAFRVPKVGYYEIIWESADDPGLPVRSSTTVWATTNEHVGFGYHQSGVEIIVDKDTFRTGRKAPVMIVTPASDRYVLFTIEGSDLHDYQLVHVAGTVKLIEVEIGERHVPNIWLSAALVQQGKLLTDTEEIIVPATAHFLEVEVRADRELYEPGAKGKLTVRTTDVDGKPVSAEVAIGLVDESIYYIQEDQAGDPRPFFFGTRQNLQVQSTGTFDVFPFVRLIADAHGHLWDERNWRQRRARGEAEEWGNAGRHKDGTGSLFFNTELASASFADDGREYDRSRRAGVGGARSAPAAESMGLAAAAEMGRKSAGLPGAGADGSSVEVVVRSDFRATALWLPSVVTDSEGRATVEATYPESLTSWKATARAVTTGNMVGIGETTTKTQKPLMVRLQGPRFLVVGDKVTYSAIVNNNTNEPLEVKCQIETTGLQGFIKNGGAGATDSTRVVEVPAQGEVRVDWWFAVAEFGDGAAEVTVVVEGPSAGADAMVRAYPIYEHGIERLLAKSGKVRGDEVLVKLNVPAARKKETTEFVVTVTPSIAVTMLDALPYLIDYPYGCTEQTMSRFLPTVATLKTLEDLGISREMAATRVFGGIEPGVAEKVMQGKPEERGKRDLALIEDMSAASLKRLYDMQKGDGGWGWWKIGRTDKFMSAYVVWGMGLAIEAGIEVDLNSYRRGLAYLDTHLVEAERQPDLQAWMLHALAAARSTDRAGLANGPSKFEQTAFANVWRQREHLNAYTRALLALTAHGFGDHQRARILIANLENGVQIDARPDLSVVVKSEGIDDRQDVGAVLKTAHWGEDGIYYRWSDGGVEATATVLRALLAIEPTHELVEPVMNWLVKNRRGAQWSNTRDTALVVLALNKYLQTSGELRVGAEKNEVYDIFVNGAKIATREVTAETVLTAPSRILVPADQVVDGENTVRIVRRGGDGNGALYFGVEAKFFSLEEPIPASGNELFVRREYYKLVPTPTLLKGHVNVRVPLGDGDSIRSGERVEVVVTVEAKNNYEYLLFEDLKPAGFEAVEVKSGGGAWLRELKSGTVTRQFGKGEVTGVGSGGREIHLTRDKRSDYTGATQRVHQEWRDRKVAMFADRLKEGIWEIRYELRAEVPGVFHALPLLGSAMYVPEIRANGAELRVQVLEREEK